MDNDTINQENPLNINNNDEELSKEDETVIKNSVEKDDDDLFNNVKLPVELNKTEKQYGSQNENSNDGSNGSLDSIEVINNKINELKKALSFRDLSFNKDSASGSTEQHVRSNSGADHSQRTMKPLTRFRSNSENNKEMPNVIHGGRINNDFNNTSNTVMQLTNGENNAMSITEAKVKISGMTMEIGNPKDILFKDLNNGDEGRRVSRSFSRNTNVRRSKSNINVNHQISSPIIPYGFKRARSASNHSIHSLLKSKSSSNINEVMKLDMAATKTSIMDNVVQSPSNETASVNSTDSRSGQNSVKTSIKIPSQLENSSHVRSSSYSPGDKVNDSSFKKFMELDNKSSGYVKSSLNSVDNNIEGENTDFRKEQFKPLSNSNSIKLKSKLPYKRNTIYSTAEYMDPSKTNQNLYGTLPHGLSNKSSLPDMSKSILNKVKMEDTGSGNLYHPVRSHSLNANKMFNNVTITDVPGENGISHKRVTKKTSFSVNEGANASDPTLSSNSSIKNPAIQALKNNSIGRSNTFNTTGYKNNDYFKPNNDKTGTLNSRMYLKPNANNQSNDQLYRSKTITSVEAYKKTGMGEFEINDRDLYENFDISKIEITENPLLSPNPNIVMCPNLIDAISTSIPIDAWDFSDDEDEPPTPLFLEMDENFDPLEGLHTEPRGYVVANLFETEKNYLSDLYTLNNFFKEKLKNIISPITLNSIFEGVDELLELHKRFYKSLYKIVCNWNKNSLVGKLFIEYRSEWQIYQNFIDNYARSLEAIRREEESNPQFRQFMKDCLASTETNRKSLKEYLMFPVQRTTRYSLIIKDLIKYIDKNHPDYEDLNLALDEMTLLATKVNDVKRREEETTSMFTAFEQTENCPPTIITHKRRLLYQVDVIDALNKNHRQMHIFLFSDLLMLTKVTKNGTTTANIMSLSHPLVRALKNRSKQTYKYVRCIDYRDLTVEEGDQSQQKNTIRLILNYKKENYMEKKKNKGGDSANDFSTPSGTTFTSHRKPDSEYTLYCFQFVQYDAEKQYRKFLLALKSIKEGKETNWIAND